MLLQNIPVFFASDTSLLVHEWANSFIGHAAPYHYPSLSSFNCVQVGIHSSVDFRHTNTRPSLPLIFILDSSVKTTFCSTSLFCFHLFSPYHSLFRFFWLIKGFLCPCLPLHQNNFSRRLVVFSLTVFLILAPHSFADVFADDLRFSPIL